ncbi:DUF2169 family type VI secretion system accessory protein [Enhygromyxa salina]|uniref:DUF2169 domain-containing protein n=1 Tax=Enhygromyxa salina TaxID=215803 RepID=A0A2S9YMK7_9BACT|nr:DUF2169 domain-containing protein [Enhygromyxa salina]PRQ06322.1 hypothetical protein ENSA7_39990 [Enhygromyxa salina]
MLIRTALRGPVDYTITVDPDGRDRLVVVAKQSYELVHQGSQANLLPRAARAPLLEVDRFADDPASSPLIAENDYAAYKPRCDVLVHGSAHAPGGRACQTCEVEVRVGNWRKAIRVHGDRVWTGGIGGANLSPPVPFERTPISYDRAFGGTREDPHNPGSFDALRENPVGVGYEPFARGAALDGLRAPNCEYPDHPVRSPRTRHRPAALGPIGRSWLPRAPLAGTYDQRWLDQDFPFLPADFSWDFLQAAPSDQQIAWPSGGEPCVLVNLTPTGLSRFSLPPTHMPVEFIRADNSRVETSAPMDTLVIDTDRGQLSMTWRASLSLARGLDEVCEVVFGPMPPSWSRAREQGKTYYRSLGEFLASRR